MNQAPSSVAECVHVGQDWLLYTGAPGDFERSEMLVPCVLLGPPGGVLRLASTPGAFMEAGCLLHAGGHMSEARARGIAILYWDPMAYPGLAIQHHASTGPRAWALPAAIAWTQAQFQALCTGQRCPPTPTTAWVESVRMALEMHLPAPPAVKARLQNVAAVIAEQQEGRISVANLAATAGISGDHLRQEFRQVVGMTLSRYQMWQRLHRMLCHTCEILPQNKQRVSVDVMIHGAGFYDMSHGYRAIRRYFGVHSPTATVSSMRFVDCRW